MRGSRRLDVECPAKVNLSLRVLGLRADGYHEIRTVFQAIELSDRLEVAPADELEIVCDRSNVPEDASNLVLRTARRVQEAIGERRGARFCLRKRIPVGGGLGGGSSNAAGALVLLERLWGRRLATRERREIAREIGADVSFFLVGGTAGGRGRGDEIESMGFVGPSPILLAVPAFGIDTSEVYRRSADRLTLRGKDVSVPRLSGRLNVNDRMGEFGINDLEAVVFRHWPSLRTVRDDLVESGARFSLVSGSGATVFGVFGSVDELDRAATRLSSRYDEWRIIRTKSVPYGIR